MVYQEEEPLLLATQAGQLLVSHRCRKGLVQDCDSLLLVALPSQLLLLLVILPFLLRLIRFYSQPQGRLFQLLLVLDLSLPTKEVRVVLEEAPVKFVNLPPLPKLQMEIENQHLLSPDFDHRASAVAV